MLRRVVNLLLAFSMHLRAARRVLVFLALARCVLCGSFESKDGSCIHAVRLASITYALPSLALLSRAPPLSLLLFPLPCTLKTS